MYQRFFILFFLTGYIACSFSQAVNENKNNRLEYLLGKVISSTNSDPDSALFFCRMGIEESTASGDTISMVEFSTWLGRIYTIKADYARALEILIRSQNIANAYNDIRGEAFSVLSQGNIFFFHKLNVEALEYYKEALKLSEKCNDSVLIASAYHNAGLAYFNGFSDFDTAMYYMNKALTIFQNHGDSLRYHFTLYNIGSNYYDQHKYDSALYYLDLATFANGKYLGKSFYGDIILTQGSIFMQQGQLEKAETVLLKGLKMVKETNTLFYVEKGYRQLAQLYSEKGEINKSLKYSQLALNLKDSLDKKDLSRKIALLRIKQELELKEQEIRALKAENLLAEEHDNRQKLRLYIASLFSGLLIVIFVLLFRQFKAQQRFGKKLEKQVEEKTHELALALEEAKKSDQLKTRFLQNISHEIRTPINAIQGFSCLLMDMATDNETQREYAGIIAQNSDYIIELFDNITYLSRLENNDLKPLFARFLLTSLTEPLVEKFNKRAFEKYKGMVEVGYQQSKELDTFFITGDADILYRLLYILLDNALKHTIKGSIALKATKAGNLLTFCVSDTGVGIPEENHHEVFDKFIKINLLEDRFTRGAGLGLPIARLIVKLLDGKIWFTSTPGKGSEFFVQIPVKH